MSSNKSSVQTSDVQNPTPKDLLRVNALLINLGNKEFEDVFSKCTFIEFKKGDIIVAPDMNDNSVYFVISGEARILDGVQEGLDYVYNDVNSGGWFGEIAAIDDHGRTATVSALVDTTVAAMPREVFINLILEYRTIALKVLEDFSSFVRSSNQRVTKVSNFSGVQRVYMEILNQAIPDPDGDGTWIVSNNVKHKDLAVGASTSPEIVTRAISQLLKMGVVKREGGSFRILDRQRVQQMVS
ncbi:MAG: Crp/Fnr family transcriptional regulator [Rhodospirillales bacterium]|nr:Crp/Fnr family transcriptional regulator [Rhodospirillales bacterium]